MVVTIAVANFIEIRSVFLRSEKKYISHGTEHGTDRRRDRSRDVQGKGYGGIKIWETWPTSSSYNRPCKSYDSDRISLCVRQYMQQLGSRSSNLLLSPVTFSALTTAETE